MRLGTVIITYNPSIDRLKKSVKSIKDQSEKIIIVDNGSSNIGEICTLISNEKIEIIRNDRNYGIAKALNIGMQYMLLNHFDWALTLDQDSICTGDFIVHAKKLAKYKSIGIICPAVAYRGWPSRTPQHKKKVSQIKACMTSGSLTRVAAWSEVKGYDESFFIDYVDNDFCEKLKIRGYKIVRINDDLMSHELGEPGIRMVLGHNVRYAHHAAWRYYYMIRNNLVFIRRYRKRLNVPKEYLKVLYIILMALSIEHNKVEIFKNIIHGARNSIKMA